MTLEEKIDGFENDAYQEIDNVLKRNGCISKSEINEILNKCIWRCFDIEVQSNYYDHLIGYKCNSIEELLEILNKEKS